MPYDPLAKVDCPGCNKLISMSNYSKHLKVCKANKPKVPYRLLDYPLTFDKPLFHVMYRTDCLNAEDDSAFLNNWDIYNNIYAHCGPHKDKSLEIDSVSINSSSTKHEHAHFIGSWSNTTRVKSSSYLASFFNTKGAYKCLNLHVDTTEPYVAHFRVLQVILYIQTVNGKHIKFDHLNEIKFGNDYYKKKYLKELSSHELWIAAQYHSYLIERKQKYEQLKALFNMDPVKYQNHLPTDYMVSRLDTKIEFCEKIMVDLTGNLDIPTYDDMIESYNKYINT